VSPKAVDWHDGNKKNPPTYKYERCIRCYCCQELCPESAIYLKVPFIRRIVGKKSSYGKVHRRESCAQHNSIFYYHKFRTIKLYDLVVGTAIRQYKQKRKVD